MVGAALGEILVNFAKTWFTGVLPSFWLFALGLLFILVTVFMPKGLLGLFSRFQRRQAKPAAPDAPVSATEAQP